MIPIYKRKPNQHKLPVGWNDMDAVKYININRISGLQHVDNVLAANQTATYNCKNMYQDESSNLTVRPSLRGLKLFEPGTKGYYDTAVGRIYHLTDSQYDLLIFENLDGVVRERMAIVKNSRIVVQEADGLAYVMFERNGTLHFDVFDGAKVTVVKPDIVTNNPNSLIPSKFNLLTDEYYANIPVLKSTAALDRPWSDYNVEYAGLLDIDDTIVYDIYIDGTVYIVTKDRLYVIGNKFVIHDLPDTITNKHDLIIWSDSTNVYLSYIRRNSGSYTFRTYAVATTSLVLDKDYTISSNIFAERPLANNKYLGWYTASAFTYRVFDAETGNSEFTANSSYNQDSYGYNFTPVITNDSVYFLDAPDIDTIALGALNFQRYNYITRTTTTLYNVKISTKNRDCTIEIIRGGYVIKYDNCADYYTALFIDADSSVGLDPMHITHEYPRIYYAAKQCTICANNVFTVWADSKYTTVDVQGYLYGGIYDNGATLFMYDTRWNLLKRTVKVEQFKMYRPVSDVYPVLTDINDKVLTSFYLDNIYWFITEHRVFGTGVANEQFSIKYFDPRKYFYFDEELTGAIRISDSSFWVFHNRGAYLIYKSSSEVYDDTLGEYVEMITWLCTSTAESKGCDFDNAVMTLPVSNYVACVTSDDISSVQMRENVQTDDRILVPMTLGIRKFVSGLLNETESVVTGTFRYNAIFFLNPQKINGVVPALVFNATTEDWWYWELPVDKIYQTNVTETGLELLVGCGDSRILCDFYTEYFEYKIGGLTYDIYADRLIDSSPIQIQWFWESSLLHFSTTDYKKQLLYINFTFGERESSTISFEYNFEVYDKEYSERSWSDVTQLIERAKTYSCKAIIAKFMYLQLYLKNIEIDEFNADAYTKPKISAISLKYRILPGGLL